MEKRKLYYAVVNDNGEQVLNALQQKGGTLSEELAKVTPRNGDVYFITEDGDIDAYDDADAFQRRVLDEFLGASGVEYARLSDAEVRDIWSKVYIVQDRTNNGADIIAELKRRGGANPYNYKGETLNALYYIDAEDNCICCTHADNENYLRKGGLERIFIPNKKIYIQSDGTKETGARIIAELERRGGVNVGGLDGSAFGYYYYIGEKKGYISSTNVLSYLKDNGFENYYMPALNKPAPAHEIAQAQHQKVYIVQDGTLNGADIIEELERRGGVNANELEGTIDKTEEPAIYYIDTDNRIETTWAHNIEDLNAQGYTRVYLGVQTPDNEPAATPTNAPVIAPNDADAQCTATPTNAPHATITDKTMTINFADAIPQGYEVVNDKGQPITEIELTLQRKHYRPSKGETYWIALLGDDDLYYPVSFVWQNADHDLGNYESGNCFKEKEQAQQLADAMNTAYLSTIKLIHNDK